MKGREISQSTDEKLPWRLASGLCVSALPHSTPSRPNPARRVHSRASNQLTSSGRGPCTGQESDRRWHPLFFSQLHTACYALLLRPAVDAGVLVF